MGKSTVVISEIEVSFLHKKILATGTSPEKTKSNIERN